MCVFNQHTTLTGQHNQMRLNPGSPVNFDVPVSDDRKFCAEVTRARETVHKWSNILLMWLHYYSIIDPLSFLDFDSNVTLWEFLLELLLDPNSQNLISWTNYDGEFRLHQSEEVARLWGLRKKRNNMNYDKLSRALRYYYDKVSLNDKIKTMLSRYALMYQIKFHIKTLLFYHVC